MEVFGPFYRPGDKELLLHPLCQLPRSAPASSLGNETAFVNVMLSEDLVTQTLVYAEILPSTEGWPSASMLGRMRCLATWTWFWALQLVSVCLPSLLVKCG